MNKTPNKKHKTIRDIIKETVRQTLHTQMNSCANITMLITKSADIKLSTYEKLQISAHNILCKGCHNFKKNNEHLTHMINHHKKNAHPSLKADSDSPENTDK